MRRQAMWAALVSCCALFPLSVYWVFYKAELQRAPLYFNQKIFYYHVSFAIMMFVSVAICGVAAVGFLRTRKPGWDDVAAAAGAVGAVFGFVVLATGSIWAHTAWGVWWTWEGRLTMSLLLFLTLVGYNLVRAFGGPGSERMAAGLAVFALASIPLVYFSVNIWTGGQHPTQNVTRTLTGEMRNAFLLSMATFACFFSVLLAVRMGAARLERRLFALRERALDAGVLE